MAKPPVTAEATAAKPIEAVKARLLTVALDMKMAGKRYSPDEAFLKDVVKSAYQTRIQAKLDALSDEDAEKIIAFLKD